MTEPALELLRGATDALEGEGAVAAVAREMVRMQGPDAGRYLQGQLSQDVVAMAGPSAWSFILQPSGRVTAWLRVHRRADDEYLLEIEPGHGEDLIARLRRFLLRTDAVIGDPEPWTLVARRHAPGLLRLGEAPEEATEEVLIGAPVGPGVAGSDLLLPGAPDAVVARLGLDPVPPAAFERHRIAHAVPAMGAELTEQTIPGEAGDWVIEASVSFTKGCYTGQELVTRIHSRVGKVPRPIRLLRLLDAEVGHAPPIGAEIRRPESETGTGTDTGTVVGAVTSSAAALGSEHPALVLAPLARAVDLGAEVDIVDGPRRHRAVVVGPPAVSRS
ncbi:MAG: hypothetical protein KGR18_09700 [Acidobacteria bacterium]|nr:hypothetical protein [Acidobacteriota bacterium]